MIQSYARLDKLKFRILVGGYLKNKELVGDTWSSTASMRTLKKIWKIQLNTKQDFIDYISLENYCKQK